MAEPKIVSGLREVPAQAGLAGFWGPLVELDGLLYATVVVFGVPGSAADRPPAVALEALAGDQWTPLEPEIVGGSLAPERFAGYGIWKSPVHAPADDYRLVIREREQPQERAE
jgi:hypothetical protein